MLYNIQGDIDSRNSWEITLIMNLNVNHACYRSHHDITDLKLIGYYSIDGEQNYRNDLSQLKYYKPPPNFDNVYFDLDKDRHLAITKPNSDFKLDHLLLWISQNFDNLQKLSTSDNDEKSSLLDTDFVCFRGVLTTILMTPYEKVVARDRGGWIICAVKYRNTIYLCQYDTEQTKRDKMTQQHDEFHKASTSWGHKFEQYLVTDDPEKEPDTSKPNNEREEFCCVFKSKFGSHTLLYGAEVDCVCSDRRIENIVESNPEFIEMKTVPNKIMADGYIIPFQRYRLLKWWCQSYLVGIQKIIVGCKQGKGIVTELKQFKVSELPMYSKHLWKDRRCKQFLNGFLKHVKEIVTEDYDKSLYKFFYDPSDYSIVQHIKLEPTDQEYAFFLEKYVQEANAYIKSKNR